MDRLCELIRQECAKVRFGMVDVSVCMEGGKVVQATVKDSRTLRYEEMPEPAEHK